METPIDSPLSSTTVPPKGTGVEKKNTIDFSAVHVDEPISYIWRDITVRSETPFIKKTINTIRGRPAVTKTLLFDVYGEAKAGELTAIMGSSGAGKTTLLNSLTFRTDRNLKVSGYRLANGITVSSASLSSISGYVQQVDLFIGTLTVKESLIFHSMLRMHKSIPFSKRLMRVEEVMGELNLTKCENTMVGVPGKFKGISGGEMKRLSFAAEVLTDPPILFCDEPTSGLDSFMAQNVVTVMRDMARKGKTVISTIHQPSSEVYAMFDKILFMGEGRLVFLGTPREASTFFKSLGSECPNNYNPADFYIHLLAIAPGKEEECRKKVAMISESYNRSKLGEELKSHVDGVIKTNTESKHKVQHTPTYKSNWCEQFRAVFWRSWISIVKDPALTRAKLIQTIFIGILVGLIYYQQGLDEDGVMNINGAIIVSITNITFQNMFAVIHVFCSEYPIFMREHINGMYRTDVYFLSKTIAELPIFIALPTIYTSIVYYMIGMNPAFERFLGAVLVMILVGNVSAAFGYVMSCTCSNIGIALSVAPPFVIPFLLFGGFFLNTRTISPYLRWFEHVTWFKYGNEAFLVNQWKGIDEIHCKNPHALCPKNGHNVLATYNFDETNFIFDIIMLYVMQTVFRIIAFIALTVRATFKLI